MPGASARSRERISEKPRPIQSKVASPLRFSKRRMARRWRVEPEYPREQAKAVRHRTASAPLQNTRFHGQQVLELRQIAERLELGILFQLLFVFEAFFQGLAHILQRHVVAARLRVHFGEVIVELGALGDIAILEQRAVIAPPFEYLRIE